LVAYLLSLVKVIRKSSTSSWDMLDRSRLQKREENLERTYSHVLMVFFFGVRSVVPKMEIDRLSNLHGVPPIVGLMGKCYP
jgi:hypothetical protein